jgi:histidyl-tRNA synthetase
MKTKALPGFRDFYPADLALRSHIFATWRKVASRYGFEEYDGPPLEPLELYTTKSGEEIVGQLYNFSDKGSRAVALRPEMTPSLARMVAARAGELKKPIRWFSIPQLFRYERQQRGRLREHFQLNCDLIGEGGPLADAEIIALAIDCMRAFGLSARDVRVRVSDRRVLSAILRERGVPDSGMVKAFEFIDKAERFRPEEIEESAGQSQSFAPARVQDLLDVSRTRGWEQLERLLAGRPALREAAEGLLQTRSSLQAMGLEEFLDLDLGIVRGLAYYTGIVFELFDAGRTLRAICGGGRYDNLLRELGGVDLPALGFGMGDVVLGELLKEKGLASGEGAGAVDVFLAFITKDDIPHVLAVVHELRDRGVRVEYPLSPQTIGKQLKLADARNARIAVVVGPDERSRGEVIVRDLSSGTQETVPQAGLVDNILRRVHG